MKVSNWHIIRDSELKRHRDRNPGLRRKPMDRQIEEILNGASHLHRNPGKKAVKNVASGEPI